MPTQESALEIALAASATNVRRWSESENLIAPGAASEFANAPTPPAAEALVRAAEPLVHRLAELAQAAIQQGYPTAAPVFHLEMASVVASPWFGSSGSYTSDLLLGLTARFRESVHEVSAALDVEPALRIAPLRPAHRTGWKPIPVDAIAYVAAAALDRAATERRDANYRYELERIQSLLGLRPSEVAQLLRVSHEGLRKWIRGGAIAGERLADIDDLYEFGRWLSSHVKPEHVQAFMRRRIPALGNRTPLEWAMAGRLPELRAMYRKAFSYEQLA